MTTESDLPSSPACLLHEADELYAGFARPADIQARLREWIACAPSADIAARLTALLRPPVTPIVAGTPLTAADLRGQMNRFLPKIRDDPLHRAVTDIAGRL